MAFLWSALPAPLASSMQHVMTHPIGPHNPIVDVRNIQTIEQLCSAVELFSVDCYEQLDYFLKKIGYQNDPIGVLAGYASETIDPFIYYTRSFSETVFIEPVTRSAHECFRSFARYIQKHWPRWANMCAGHPSSNRILLEPFLVHLEENIIHMQLALRISRGMLYLPSEEIFFLCGSNHEVLISKIVNLIVQKTIQYPFKRYWKGSGWFQYCFSNLKKFQPRLHAHNTIESLQVSFYDRKLYSFTAHDIQPYLESFLSKNQHGKYVTILSVPKDYHQIDIMSDLYIEDVRLAARRLDQTECPLDAFFNPVTTETIVRSIFADIQQGDTRGITPETLREAAFREIKECTQFKSSLAIAIFKMFKATCVLDMSAGWGDRLLAAMAAGISYIGVDPNEALKSGHTAMIKECLSPPKRKNIQMIYEPFETVDTEKFQMKPDLIFSSPPFFNFEHYSSQSTQSIVRFPTQLDWIVYFLFVSMWKAFQCLQDGGHMVIHITDMPFLTICEPMCLFMDAYVPQSHYCGMITSISTPKTTPRPMWIWEKKAVPSFRKDRIITARHHLDTFYPELSRRLSDCKF